MYWVRELATGQDEAVPAEPVRVRRVVTQHALVEGVRKRCQGHCGARVSGSHLPRHRRPARGPCPPPGCPARTSRPGNAGRCGFEFLGSVTVWLPSCGR